MEQLSKLILLSVATLLIFPVAPYLTDLRLRRVFIFLHALILTLLTIFPFERPDWKWDEHVEFVKGNSEKVDDSAYNFVNSHFLLVNNSYDKELIPNPAGDEDDSTKLVITNRKSLTGFLHLLNEHKPNIDLVVLDINLSAKTDQDAALRQEILNLHDIDNKHNKYYKIILSKNYKDKDQTQPINDETAYGNINVKGNGQIITSQTIYNGTMYSLPYMMYRYLNKVEITVPFFDNYLITETDSLSKSTTCLNNFFPVFSIQNENILKRQPVLNNKEGTLSVSQIKDTEYSRNYFDLSYTLSREGELEFLNALNERKNSGKKTIVFIGCFDGMDEDMHETPYGILHGPTIIINQFYALIKKQHYFSYSYAFFLFLGFLVITFFLLKAHLPVKLKIANKPKKIFIKRKYRYLTRSNLYSSYSKKSKLFTYSFIGKNFFIGLFKWLWLIAKCLVDFLIHEDVAITSLIILTLSIKIITGHLINVLCLGIYLTIFKHCLSVAAREIINTPSALDNIENKKK